MSDRRLDALISLTCFGAVVVGILGILGCVIALVAGEFLAAGVAVLGSGLAFGLLANALLRS